MSFKDISHYFKQTCFWSLYHNQPGSFWSLYHCVPPGLWTESTAAWAWKSRCFLQLQLILLHLANVKCQAMRNTNFNKNELGLQDITQWRVQRLCIDQTLPSSGCWYPYWTRSTVKSLPYLFTIVKLLKLTRRRWLGGRGRGCAAGLDSRKCLDRYRPQSAGNIAHIRLAAWRQQADTCHDEQQRINDMQR